MKQVKNRGLLLFLFSLLSLSAVGYSADCSYKLRHPTSVLWKGDGDAKYNIFDTQGYIQAVAFEIGHKDTDDCPYFVGCNAGEGGDYSTRFLQNGQGDVLPYQLYTTSNQSNIIKTPPEASSNSDVLHGTVNPGDGRSTIREYYFHVFPGAIVPDGTYTDTFVAELYRGTIGGAFTLLSSKTVRLKVSVPHVLQLSMVNTGQAFDPAVIQRDVDFGDLEEGKSVSFSLSARSNAPFRIDMRSENRGVLKHIDGIAGEVPYTLAFNGVMVDLSGGASTTVWQETAGLTPSEGLSYPVTVTIGMIDYPPAGNYSDWVYVTARVDS